MTARTSRYLCPTPGTIKTVKTAAMTTTYGGIYRDVLLAIVNKDHFDLDHFGTPGIKVTSTVEGKDSRVRVETFHRAENAQVKVELMDAAGKTVAVGNGTDITLDIANVRLWNGVKDPYLYTAQATLVVNGQEVDQVSTRFGVRSFQVDPDRGFFLNGEPYPLHGVSRHQDWKGLGNAITDEHHRQDMELIAESSQLHGPPAGRRNHPLWLSGGHLLV